MSKSLVSTLLLSVLTVVPLFFWTLTPNYISTPKEILVTTLTITLLLSMVYTSLTTKKLSLAHISDSLPLFVFMLCILGSIIANPEGRPEALSGKGLLFFILPIISYFALTSSSSTSDSHFKNVVLGSGFILSLHSLLSLTLLSKSPYLPSFMQNLAFTPTGSYITTLTLILGSLTLGLGTLKYSHTHKYLSLATLALGSIASVAILSLMLPGRELAPSLLTYQESWSIALDALKSLRTLFFGVGLSNYSVLFSAVKPLSVNASELWNTLPTSSASEILTLLPTAGVLATASFLYLMLKSLFRSYQTPYFYLTILISLALLLTPATLPLYLLFFLVYAQNTSNEPTYLNLKSPYHFVVAGLALVISLALAYPSIRMLLSEYALRRAQLALAASDSQQVYESHLRALRYSPNITNYHLSFADVNFRLASALSQKTELSDTERETITNLIQQSIQSSKTAIALRPSDSRTWTTIAKIYQNLINVATGADNFALEAYARAINLDRANPTLRVEYASLLSQLASKQTESTSSANLNNRAMLELQTAIQLKNNFANAHYNLAKLYELSGNINNAITTLQSTLKYLDENSNDYNRIRSELETLKSKGSLPTASPSPFPSPLDGGPIEIPAP